MIKKITYSLGILFVICSLRGNFLFSQDIFPAKSLNELRQINNNALYKGKVFKISDNILFRTRIYGRDYVQNTFIIKENKIEFRLYFYLKFSTFNVSNAVSLRYYL